MADERDEGKRGAMEAGGEGQGRGEASVAGEIDKASWWRSEQHHVLRQYTHGIETRTTRGGFTLRSGVLQVAWLVSEANTYTALTRRFGEALWVLDRWV